MLAHSNDAYVAIRADTGRVLWRANKVEQRQRACGKVFGLFAGICRGLLIAVSAGGNGIRAIKIATGHERWQVRAEEPADIVVAGDRVFTTSGAELWELDPRTGRLARRWRFEERILNLGAYACR